MPNSLYERDFTGNIEHFGENVKYEAEKKFGKIVISQLGFSGVSYGPIHTSLRVNGRSYAKTPRLQPEGVYC